MQTGKLVVVKGPMFAGKTTKLMEIYDQEQWVAIFKPSVDKRYAGADFISTHDGKTRPCTPVDSVKDLASSIQNQNPDTVILDEIHFFPVKDIIGLTLSLLDQGKNVVVAGVDTDEDFGPFPAVNALALLTDQVHQVSEPCCCGNGQTLYTVRTLTPDNYINPVGGAEKYKSLCEACTKEHVQPGRGNFDQVRHKKLEKMRFNM